MPMIANGYLYVQHFLGLHETVNHHCTVIALHCLADNTSQV